MRGLALPIGAAALLLAGCFDFPGALQDCVTHGLCLMDGGAGGSAGGGSAGGGSAAGGGSSGGGSAVGGGNTQQPSFEFTGGDVAFPDTLVGGPSAVAGVHLTNTGPEELTGFTASIDGGAFAVDGGCALLPLDGGGCDLQIFFTPPSAGPFAGELTVHFTSAIDKQRALSGTGFTQSMLTVLTTGSGQVTIGDAGTCPGMCNFSFRDGTGLTLSARPGISSGLESWSGPCSGQGPICQFVINGPQTTLATFAQANRVFVTASGMTSNFGGRIQADNNCYYAANDAGFAGTFKALIAMADGGNAVKDLTALNPRGFVRADGLPVADTLDELLAGSFLYAPNQDQHGARADTSFWSGLLVDGGTSTQTCNNWTANSSSFNAAYGYAATGSELFMAAQSAGFCITSAPLFCVEYGRNVQIVVPPVPQGAKRAFLSDGVFNGSIGPATANALCQGEATAAGLGGTFVALRSSVADAGMSLLAPDAGPIYRLDGVRWVSGAAALRQALVDAPLNVKTDGGRVLDSASSHTWTGGQPAYPSQPGNPTLFPAACAEWTSSNVTDTGCTGAAVSASAVQVSGPGAFMSTISGNETCDKQRHLYCVEP